jgi:predicted nucleotidyltransferase
MEGWTKKLLKEAHRGLEDLYGDRLEGVYLFGSRARGEAATDSDVDLLIVLDGVEDYVGEIRHTSELIASLCLRYDASISRVFVSAAKWREGEGPFLNSVRQDAVAADRDDSRGRRQGSSPRQLAPAAPPATPPDRCARRRSPATLPSGRVCVGDFQLLLRGSPTSLALSFGGRRLERVGSVSPTSH